MWTTFSVKIMDGDCGSVMKIKTTKWILVAEDDDAVRKSICDLLLSHFGSEIRIVEVSNGAAAISKLSNQTFHIIITDLNMPRKGGTDVVQAARANQFNETTPIVLISSHGSSDIEKKYEFVNFVPKPLDPFGFAKIIQNLFRIGSTEKMISASIFNSLLDSSLAFLKEALKREDFDVGEMSLKRNGKELTADHAAIITLHIGKVSNTFSVLCSKETLEELRSGSERISGSSLDVICRSLGYVILRHVLEDCGIIDSNEVKTKDITQDPAVLTKKQGIVLPITSKGIQYKIFATTSDDF